MAACTGYIRIYIRGTIHMTKAKRSSDMAARSKVDNGKKKKSLTGRTRVILP
jgi:hypothetical protein